VVEKEAAAVADRRKWAEEERQDRKEREKEIQDAKIREAKWEKGRLARMTVADLGQ